MGSQKKDSPLERECSLSICPDVPEDTDIYMPMASRVVQMTIIDVLATGFTLRRGAGFRDNLKRVKESLKDSRFSKEPHFLSFQYIPKTFSKAEIRENRCAYKQMLN